MDKSKMQAIRLGVQRYRESKMQVNSPSHPISTDANFGSGSIFIHVIKLFVEGKWGGRVVSLRQIAENIFLTLYSFLVFENAPVYLQALLYKNQSRCILKTRSGLQIVFRQNLYDARILRESFLEKPYLEEVKPGGVIIDIGGYIGDFALYAAKQFSSRVIVYEPTEENFVILKENVIRNNLQSLVTINPMAISATGGPLSLFIQKSHAGEIHASSNIYGTHYNEPVQRVVESVSLDQMFADHNLVSVDLLKIDIEGGEYDVFESMPDELFDKIQNIVFEYHPIQGYIPRLTAIMRRLTSLNYKVIRKGSLVRANKNSTPSQKLGDL